MIRGELGQKVCISTAGEKCFAFVPLPLPPVPSLAINDELQSLLTDAALELGRLDTIVHFIRDVEDVFIYSYVRKEAVLSSQIEGTQSSLADLMLFETSGKSQTPIDDVQEVCNYVAAMHKGMDLLKQGFPICTRLILEVHAALLSKGRGSQKVPGEYRTTQNWIGGSRPGNAVFVPPPPSDINGCMYNLEQYINSDAHPLIKAALTHVQFETIHPFLDGNGRLGRILISLMLYETKILGAPLLYLSLYFKEHRQKYYSLLQEVRERGNWEAWLHFFLTGVRAIAQEAFKNASSLQRLFEEDQAAIGNAVRTSSSALRLHTYLKSHPITSACQAAKSIDRSVPSVNASMERLRQLGIVHELTGMRRNKVYFYKGCLDILNVDMKSVLNAPRTHQ